ncbi:universal stress protein [Amycolatopsis sp. SID8362]|uniref:universal stress protein n=1 Tax=Amycolatopsis sp. SID8362 TaxID=2690346 RepID=UPI00136805A0|nr:universal stress protein [Amycolatopsis sp. SID8362]NBH04889.1 universal stress protein [Amycolatopsis sp. SID8362]NED41590.1 universal stress protein [Amycolatopsis sp. SID8362]
MSGASAAQRWVLAGYDGSDQAAAAVEWAAEEAASRGGALAVVQVVHWPPPSPQPVPGTDEAEQELTARTHAETLLSDLADELGKSRPELTVRTSVESGRTGETLARAAREAELLVIGASGRGALPRVVLGSTAAELLHSCDRPVVVVRSSDSYSASGPVVVGVDGSELSAAAVAFAYDFADRHQRELLAVHAWADLPMHATEPVGGWAEDWQDISRRGQELLADSLAAHAERHPDVVVRRTVSIDRPARALLDTADGAALLVVGSHGRGTLGRLLLGSVSHAMIYHAPCPVAVVHPPAKD